MKQSSFIYLSAEEGMNKAIMPRLIAAGADLDKWIPMKANLVLTKKDGTKCVDFKSFNDLDYWKDIFRRLPDVKLMVVDPIPAFLGRGVDDHRNNSVREAMRPFLELIEEKNIAVLAITHLNKSVQLKAIHRVMGSVAYTALADRGAALGSRPGRQKALLPCAAPKDRTPSSRPH